GWPMSVWRTPDLQPFFGGTYFPPADRGGRPGFPTVLQRLAAAWKDERKEVIKAAAGAMQALAEYTAAGAAKSEAAGRGALTACFNQLARSFDDDLGGFGRAPKFPRPVALNFLLRIFAREGAGTPDGRAARAMTLFTLRAMAAGGLRDHLGGGFHRYSVDKFWHVPHFEKMLYDQAQLACAYLDGFQVSRGPAEEKVAREILDYVLRDLTDKGGGFYSAEDADSVIAHGQPEHAEGAFYVWKKADIDAALGAGAAKLFHHVYGVEAKGNAPAGSDPLGEFKGANILIQRHSPAEAAQFFQKPEAKIAASLAASKKKLLELRAKRPRPHLDDKTITAGNGLMISAFARAHQVLGEPRYLQAAQRATAFIEAKLSDKETGKLWRRYRAGEVAIDGFLDDYAFFIQGLIDLYEASFDVKYLSWAIALQDKQNALFWDQAGGGYFSTTGQDPSVILRMKDDYDGAEPSANSVAALNLLRLSQMTDNREFRDNAEQMFAVFSTRLQRAPSALPQMLVAFDFHSDQPRQIIIAGKPDAPDTRALLREVHARFIPNKILLLADGAGGQAMLAGHLEFIKSVRMIDGKATAFICENYVCNLPTNDPAALARLLDRRTPPPQSATGG
ncbi:thioredoxin domain-containing protein, partial [bacterium]|nr:thioredoxin domain-containing protein [bacterium]